MAKWKGQSRGTVLGHKIFVFIIRNFGLRAAYALLVFVAAYFLVFALKPTKAKYVFFHKRLGYSSLKAFFHIYKSYYTFGQSLIDRIAIASGQREKFTFEFDGIEHIENLLSSKTGGLLFTAHIGNINVAKYFFEDIHAGSRVKIVVTDQEHQEIKAYLESVSLPSKTGFIIAKEDMSHVFQIDQALKNNALIVFAADRKLENRKSLYGNFLGKTASFFYGPFEIATRKNLPVVFAYVMKEPKLHYHLYARPCPKFSGKQELLGLYLENLEKMVRSYPNQWFNFYDYWEDFDPPSTDEI